MIQGAPCKCEIQKHPKFHERFVPWDAVTSVWLWGDRCDSL